MESVTQTPFDSRISTFEHMAEVRGLLLGVVKELIDRAHVHDNSKLESPELEVFDEVTPRLAELKYGSEEYKQSLTDMGPALTHHYTANQGHHPDALPRGILSMSLIDLLEMCADWVAAVKRHETGDIRDSIEKNQERFHYDDQIKTILHNTVDALEALS